MSLRPPLQKVCFRCFCVPTGNLFFFLIFFLLAKNFSYFLTKQKKRERERICGSQSVHNFGHPLDKKHFFLRVA